MSLTLEEICDKLLAQYDVELLLEMLQVTAEELLDHFGYKIEELDIHEKLSEELEDA